ncbi:MAG: Transcriptional regulator [Bacilli bacterium]|nr:Transcriptional regulator [Bacilli bacterium]
MHNKDLVLEQYGTKKNLQTRVNIHKLYSQAPFLFAEWAFNQIEFKGSERALDAGCGSGAWLFPLATILSENGGSVVGIDLSEGMLSDIRAEANKHPNVELCIGDVQNLQFADESFDLVMANFMLYHVPDINRALEELKRVLKPGGKLMAATNSQLSMGPLWDMHVECQRKAAIPEHIVLRSVPNVGFSLENGSDFLRPHFQWFESNVLYDLLKFTDPEPLMDYYSSGVMKHGDTDNEISDNQWQCVYDFVREEVVTIINGDGCFSLPKTAGFFVAQNP